MWTAINKLRRVVLLLCMLLPGSCREGHRPPGAGNADKPPILPVNSVYYVYGGPPEPALEEAQEVVLARYGLSCRGVGCVVTDSLIEAIQQHNDSLFRHLQKRFSGVSEDRLRQEIQAYRHF